MDGVVRGTLIFLKSKQKPKDPPIPKRIGGSSVQLHKLRSVRIKFGISNIKTASPVL